MSIKLVKNAMQNFLEASSPAVLVIKGDWGVGKTYLWNHAVEEKETLGRYYYTSLFGLKSIEELQVSLVMQPFLKFGIKGARANEGRILQRIRSIIKDGNLWKELLQKLPGIKNLPPRLVEHLLFSQITRSIICIDDVERAGHGITFAQVLGFANQLKEKEQCKVVLIYNERELGEEAKTKENNKAFQAYFEKVVDVEIPLAPTPQECVEIALSTSDDSSSVLSEKDLKKLRESCIKLKLNNIRIITRIEKMANQMRQCLKDIGEPAFERALHSLVLFATSRFSALGSPSVPNIEYIKSFDFDSRSKAYFFDLFSESSEEISEENKIKKENGNKDEEKQDEERRSQLTDYGFWGCSDFDREIIKFVESGCILNEDTFKSLAQQDQEKNAVYEAQIVFNQDFASFIGDFSSDKNDAVDKLCKSFNNKMKYLKLGELPVISSILQDLNRNEEAEDFVRKFLDLRFEELFVDKGMRGVAIRDEMIKKAIATKREAWIAEKKKSMPLSKILERIMERNLYDDLDLALLSDISSNEFYNLFKTEQDPKLKEYINVCFEFGLGEQVEKKAREALQKISKASSFNALKMKYRRLNKYLLDEEDGTAANIP